MTAASVTARGRAAAEALMVDACVIRRQVGTTTDPDTGAVTPSYEDVYSGKCRVQSRNLSARSPNSGQQRVDLYAVELQLPITVTGVAVNDVAEITVSLDPELPTPRADGTPRLFRVNNLFHKTHATSRRLSVEEVTG